MRIAVIAMSAKPPTAGHFALIKIAARECDEVQLFVSLNDRKRPGEVPILGNDMEFIWNTYIQETLPANVKVTYLKNETPVRKVYEFLGKQDTGDDEYVIYSDPSDIQKNFSHEQLDKYLNSLHSKGRITLEPVSREETVDVSGTKMRKWLETGDKDSFIAHLPSVIQDRGDEIWSQLQVSIALNPIKRKKHKMFKV